jgi:hypothetical protein
MNKLKTLFSNPLLWLILAVALGVFLRLEQYMQNRAMWIDEVMLAKNIIGKTYVELTGPLEHEQCAPIGFLFTERLFVTWAGTSEYVLRLFPLLCGIASIFVFMAICHDMVSPAAVAVGVLLFSVSGQLIYYASEVKQYGSDVFIGLYLLWLAMPLLKGQWTMPRMLLTAISGFFLVFFSHSAVFVLAGISAGFLISIIENRQKKSFFGWLLFCVIWGVGFVVHYVFFLSRYKTSDSVIQFWTQMNAFAPVNFYTPKGLLWFPAKFLEVLANPCGFWKQSIILPPFLIGVFFMWKRYKPIVAMTAGMIFFLSVASAMQKFPFSQRLILFLVPFVLLYIVLGTDYLIKISWNCHRLLTVVVLFWIVYPSAALAMSFPVGREEITPLLKHLERNARQGESLYVYRGGWVAFDYYKDRYDLDKLQNITLGQFPITQKDILETVLKYKALRKKTWFLFSHTNLEQREMFLVYLNQYGQCIQDVQETGASLYLYDFPESAEAVK